MVLFLLGFISCFIWMFIGVIIIKELIFKTNIVNFVQNRATEFKSATAGTSILYPKIEEELFKNKEDLTIDELLEK